MKTIKLWLILIAIIASLSSVAQSITSDEELRYLGNELYIQKNGESHRIEQGTIIVKPKTDSVTRKTQLGTSILGYYCITVPKGICIEDYAKELQDSGDFESVEYNSYADLFMTPNDTKIGYQWYLEKINAYEAWNITTGNASIKIGVIDTGIDCTHSDIGVGIDGFSNIDNSLGYNATTLIEEHGTAIAGIIGAKTNNGMGLAGVAGGNQGHGATIVPYYIGETPTSYAIATAITNAVDQGVNVIQMSLGTDSTSFLKSALDYAYNNDVTVVCASGNGGVPSVRFPARYQTVIAVGATSSNNHRWLYSCYGANLDIVAPGDSIYHATFGNGYSVDSGTSLAAPQVSAVAALMLSVNPDLTPHEIRSILINSAYKIPYYFDNNIAWSEWVGYGLLDAYKAVLNSLSITISGNDRLCGEEIYTISGIPAGASVSLGTNTGGFWIQKSSNISFDSYNSTTGELSVQQTTPGNGYIKVYYDDHLLATKEFWVGGPEITNFYYMGNTLYAEASALSFYWNINGTTFWSREGRKYYPLADGTYNVSVYAVIPNCGAGPTYTTQLHVSDGNMYSLGAISSDHQVSIETVDYSDSPQPLEAMQTMTSKQAANDVPYELKNAMTGEVSARGEMPAEGGVLDFSRVRSGLYVLTLSPAGREPETFKLSLK